MTAPGPAPQLERGDRMPNFVLPNYDGRGMMFYDMAAGNPGIVLVEAERDERTDAAVAAIAGAAGRMAEAALELTVIDRRDADENRKIAETLGRDVPVLSDPAGRIGAALRRAAFSDGKGPPVFALAYSANQRIVSVIAPGGRPMIETALAALAAPPPDSDAPVLTGQAPVLVIPDLVSAEQCAALIEHWRSGHSEGTVSAYREGKAFGAIETAQKKRRDRMLDDRALRAEVMDRIARRLVTEVYKAFAYQNFILEPPIVVCYDAERQDYFRRHRDNLSPQTASRRFALSLNLNEDYEGGTLVFPEYGGREYCPPAGAGVVFSCAHVHEARPVTRGERFVLLTFLHDPDRKPHPWSMPDQRQG